MPVVQFPRRVTSTATTITVSGLPSWVPAAGFFKDVSLANPNEANPDPTNQAVYRGGNGYEGSWVAFCGGTYAPTLGAYGSLLFFGGGNGAYDGNAVTKYDIEARRSSRVSEPALYGTKAPAGPGGVPPAVDNYSYSPDPNGVATNVDIYGGWPNNTPFPCHTYQLPTFLPADAGGGTLGSWVYLSHPQNHTAISAHTFWMLNLATKVWSKWTPGPQFGIYNNNGLCYDPNRKGIWAVAPASLYGLKRLWFFDLAGQHYTQVPLSGSAIDGGGTYSSPNTPYQPGPVYMPNKDCIVFAASQGSPRMVVTDVSGVTVTGGVASGGAVAAVMNDTGTRCPSLFWSGGGADIGKLEYCSLDGNLWGLDQYDISANKARFYRLSHTSGSVTAGTWTWTLNTLDSADGSPVRLKSSAPPNFYPVGDTPWMGRFAFVPPLKSFVWSDHPNLPVQMGRPTGFV